LATAGGRKLVRYFLVSIVNFTVGESVLGLSYLFLHWSALTAAVVAVSVATIPAYFLNRIWVWGRSGRSHLMTEVVPFWALAFVYLLVSAGAAQAAAALATSLTASRPVQTVVIVSAIPIVSVMLWLIRFYVLDTVVFTDRPRVDQRGGVTADAGA
jgi:putative flippase GtrA